MHSLLSYDLRRRQFDVVEPDIRIEAGLCGKPAKPTQIARPRIVGGESRAIDSFRPVQDRRDTDR
jgi:hypothetical protein